MMMRTNRGSRSNTNNVWSDTLIYMPIDVSSEVAARLPYSDLIHSAAVCRTWKAGIDHVHQNPSLLRLPSLITYRAGVVEFLDLLLNGTCTQKHHHKHHHKSRTGKRPWSSHT
ncbi:hypothetical protein ACLB2K_032522 [Fragaria x ananassa]